jgi:hypothetical protein
MKQRSKCGQRGPMRASGVVVTSLHSGADSDSHSTSARSPVSVSADQSSNAASETSGAPREASSASLRWQM